MGELKFSAPLPMSRTEPAKLLFKTLEIGSVRVSVPFDDKSRRILGGKVFADEVRELIKHPLLVDKASLCANLAQLATAVEAESDIILHRGVLTLPAQFDDYACLIPHLNQLKNSDWLRIACLFTFYRMRGLNKPKWRTQIWWVQKILRQNRAEISEDLQKTIAEYEADFRNGFEPTPEALRTRVAHLKERDMHLMLTALGAIKALRGI